MGLIWILWYNHLGDPGSHARNEDDPLGTEKMKRSIGILLGLAMVMALIPVTAFAADSAKGAEGDFDARTYNYKITPILPPFNSYFFVETDNPNPKSFRFEDKERKYIPRPYILQNAGLSDKPTIFADIHYENEETGRVTEGISFMAEARMAERSRCRCRTIRMPITRSIQIPGSP